MSISPQVQGQEIDFKSAYYELIERYDNLQKLTQAFERDADKYSRQVTTQEATIDGLLGALKGLEIEHDTICHWHEVPIHNACDCGAYETQKSINKTINALPEQLLADYQQRQAVLTAAEKLNQAKEKWGSTPGGRITDQPDQYLQAANAVCVAVQALNQKKGE